MGITTGNVRSALDAALQHERELSGAELVWLVPKMRAAADDIDTTARATKAVSTPEIESKRAEAGGFEATFDTSHRCVVQAYALAELWLGLKDPAAKTVVTTGKRSLYPDGLEITQKSWASEGDEAMLYLQRLERPEVKAAQALVTAIVPGLADIVASATTAGAGLHASMRELAVLEAGRGESPQMFAARTRGLQVLSLLRTNVDEVFPASDKANAVVREKLIGKYLQVLESEKPVPEPADPTKGGGGNQT